jgi:PAS domain S-box-containing protein
MLRSLEDSIFTIRSRMADLRRQAIEITHAAPDAGLGTDAEAVTALLDRTIAETQTALEDLRVAQESVSDLMVARKWAQGHIQAERRRYRELADLSPDGYFVTDVVGTIREANRAASVLLNIPMRFLTGKPLMAYVALEQRPALRRLLNDIGKQSSSGITLPDFVRIVPHRTLPFDATLVLRPVRNEETGELVAVRWLLRDMTEPTHAEAERYRLVVDAVEDYAIFLTDSRGRILNWNRGAQNIFGYTEIEAAGMDSARLFIPEERGHGVPEQEMQTANADGRAADERWHLRKDETRFFASGVLVPLRGAGMQGFAKILRDMTERKAMEDALTQARDQLEERVSERTAELAAANAALQAEVAERRRVEQERRELMRRLVTAQEEERRRISREMHDQMGQYLTALGLGLRALSSMSQSTERGQSLLQEMEKITEELGGEVHRLAVELRPTALDDLGLATALRGFVEEWAARTGIAADLHASGIDRPARLSDAVETTLYRVVQEALNNVLKHANAQHVSIVVDCRPEEMLLIVEDDGRGFDVEAALRSGEPLAEGTTDANTRAHRRLGLLGIHERVALVGGTTTIESSPGQGATLFLRIPLIGQRSAEPGPTEREEM